MDKQKNSSPTPHPDEQPVRDGDDSPKFGRLLLVLLGAVLLIVLITFASEAFYS